MVSTNPPSRIRVVIADDHFVTRAGIRATLEALPDVDVVGEAVDGTEAVELAHKLVPDILLLDIEMPKMTGVEVARQLHSENSPVKVVALSAYDDEDYVYGLLDSGAVGYLMKEEAGAELILEALRGVAQQGEELWISPRLASEIIRRKLKREHISGGILSRREQQVLVLVARGSANAEISSSLNISTHTVKNHLEKIRQKIRVRTRAELVAWAWQQGLVAPAD